MAWRPEPAAARVQEQRVCGTCSGATRADAPVGSFRGEMTIRTNDPRRPIERTQVLGTVLGDLAVVPPRLSLGRVQAGRPHPLLALRLQQLNLRAVLLAALRSSAHTMAEALGHLRRAGTRAPVCVGVHGLFAEDAYAQLSAVCARIVSTDAVDHPSVVTTRSSAPERSTIADAIFSQSSF